MIFKVPSHEESLHIFGEAFEKALPETFNLVVWNLYKGQGYRQKNATHFWNDFSDFNSKAHIHLFQEMLMNDQWLKSLEQSLPNKQFSFAASFEYRNQTRTGVGIASVAKALNSKLLRGTEREFFFLTPKVSLISEFHQQHHSGKTETVLVINTHVVNFTTTNSFIRFLDELVSLMQIHQGPLVFAGDFNTWSFKRWHSLIQMLARFDIFPLEFKNDPRFLKLDHVFVRGFKSLSSEIQTHINSSDHYPILVKLKLL